LKIKDFNVAEEGNFSCKQCRLTIRTGISRCSSNFIFIGVGKFFLRHALFSQLFGLCNLGALKYNIKKLAYAG